MARLLLYEKPISIIDVGPSQCTAWSGTLLKIKEEPKTEDEIVESFFDNSNSLPLSKTTSTSVKNSNSESVTDVNKNKMKTPHALKKIHSKLATEDRLVGHNYASSDNDKRRKSVRIGINTTSLDVPTLEPQWKCEICQLEFQNRRQMNTHNRNYRLSQEKSCDICNLYMFSKNLTAIHSRALHSNNTSYIKYGFKCDICTQSFLLKSSLQAHIWHFHHDYIRFRNEAPCEKIQNVQSAEYFTMPHPKPPSAVVKSMETNDNSMKDIPPPPPLKNSPSPKKMRQTTLMEFMHVTSLKCKKEPISPSKIQDNPLGNDEPSSSDNSKTTLNQSPDRNKKPFVKIHLPFTEYSPLLNDTLDSNEKKADETQRVSNSSPENRNLRRSLRRNTCDNTGDDKRRSIQSSLRSRPTKSIDSSVAKKYKCTDCTIPLVRCDRKRDHGMKINTAMAKPKSSNTDCSAPKLSKKGNLVFKEPAVCLEKMPLSVIESKLNALKIEINEKILITQSFVCKVCNAEFISKEEKKQHVRTTHTTYRSSICQARYSLKHKLIEHYLRQHYLFKRNECCVCGIPCSDRIALRCHLLLHCIKVIQSKEDPTPLNVDVICKSYRKTNKCMICDKRFWLLSSCREHERHCRRRKKNDHSKKSTSRVVQLTENDDDPPVALSELDQSQNSVPTSQPLGVSATDFKGENVISTDNPQIDVRNLYPNTLVSKTSHLNQFANPATPADIQLNSPNTVSSALSTVQGKYCCDICGNKYQMQKYLKRHLRMYSKPMIPLCNVCGLVFSSAELLQTHYNTAHNRSPKLYKYRCDHCFQGFGRKDRLRIHQLHLHPQSVTSSENDHARCPVCNLVFLNYARFLQHTTYYRTDQHFCCAFCGKMFQGMYMLHHHNKLDHYPEFARTTYDYKCDTCGEGFKHQLHFYAHKVHVHFLKPMSTEDLSNQSSNDKPLNVVEVPNLDKPMATAASRKASFSCKTCNAQFNSQSALTYHHSEFSNDGLFQCINCPRKCATLVLLNKHRILSHVSLVDERKFVCHICNEVLTSQYALTFHKKHFHEQSQNPLLSNNSPNCITYKCGICALDFSNSTELMDHVVKYVNAGDYVCNLCHQKFREPQHLQNHKKVHDELDASSIRYQCSACNQRLLSVTDVHAHIIHSHSLVGADNVTVKKVMSTQPNRNIDCDHSSDNTHLQDSTEADKNLSQDNQPLITNTTAKADQMDHSILPLSVTNASLGTGQVSEICTESVNGNNVSSKSNFDESGPDKSLVCNVCGLKFVNQKNLIRHWVRFVNKGNYICEICGKIFPWELCFKDHQRKHLKTIGMNLMYTCPLCEEKFRTAASVHAHVTHYHNKPSSSFIVHLKTGEGGTGTTDEEGSKIYFQTESGEVQEVSNRSDGPNEDGDTSINQIDTSEIQILDEKLDESNNMSTSSGRIIPVSNNILRTPESLNNDKHAAELKRIEKIYNGIIQLDKYICPLCLLDYEQLSDFQTHFRTSHSAQSIKHPRFKPSGNSESAILCIEEQNDNIACVVCGDLSTNEANFKKHLNTVHIRKTIISGNELKDELLRIIRKVLKTTPQSDSQAASNIVQSSNDNISKDNNTLPNGTHFGKQDLLPQTSATLSENEKQSNDLESVIEGVTTNAPEVNSSETIKVGSLKIKDFAKLIQMEDGLPGSSKKCMLPTSPKYVILESGVTTQSKIFVGTPSGSVNQKL